MPIENALASVAVNDVNSSARWYESVIGKAPSKPMAEVAEWRFERGGGLQVYQLHERAGTGSFTFAVSHLDEIVARLEKLKIDVGDRSANDRVKTLMITDPDGNHIAFAEVLDPALLR